MYICIHSYKSRGKSTGYKKARTQNRLKAEGFFRMNKDKEINLKTGIT